MFQPDEQMSETIAYLVAPEAQQQYLNDYLGNPSSTDNPYGAGRIVARSMGYQTREDARVNANFTVRTQQYKVDSFDAENGRATVFLYQMTRFRTREPTVRNSFRFKTIEGLGITIVEMRWSDGRWMLVGTRPPTSNEAPTFNSDETGDNGLTLDEVRERYNPYLKRGGYQRYG